MLNPSVSPFKISANGLVVESSNPAVRLYRYNTHTGEVRIVAVAIFRSQVVNNKLISDL